MNKQIAKNDMWRARYFNISPQQHATDFNYHLAHKPKLESVLRVLFNYTFFVSISIVQSVETNYRGKM